MAKKNLDDAYLDSKVEYIKDKISKLTQEHISKQHHLAWTTIEDLSGKNPNYSIRMKGGSAKKR